MKLLEVALQLHRDNPGGDWLKGKQELCDEGGLNDKGAPARFGPVTATYNRRVLLPVDVVSALPGLRGEHHFEREESMSFLTKEMSTTKRLPTFQPGPPTPKLGDPQAAPLPGDRRQYAPFITVYYDGSPWISEGNHRIKVAKKLGWKYILIELRYFSGGEDADGPLSPAKVKAYDAKAIAEGFKPDDDFVAEGLGDPEQDHLSINQKKTMEILTSQIEEKYPNLECLIIPWNNYLYIFDRGNDPDEIGKSTCSYSYLRVEFLSFGTIKVWAFSPNRAGVKMFDGVDVHTNQRRFRQTQVFMSPDDIKKKLYEIIDAWYRKRQSRPIYRS